MRYLPIEIAKHEHLEVVNVSEVVDRLEPRGEIYVHEFATISWADTERDVSAWLGNKMQRISFEKLKDIGKFIKENSNKLKNLINLMKYIRCIRSYRQAIIFIINPLRGLVI